jgi:DNA processing protein
MQTDIKGGSMHTVRHTVLQKKMLFAPVPTGDHVFEPKSQGILALTQMSARQFSEAVRAEGEYHRLLAKYGAEPVAKGIVGRSDYRFVLEQLEILLAKARLDDVGRAAAQKVLL